MKISQRIGTIEKNMFLLSYQFTCMGYERSVISELIDGAIFLFDILTTSLNKII